MAPAQAGAGGTPAPPAHGTLLYLYGVVPRDRTAVPEVPGVGTPPGRVRLVPSGQVAALVSDVTDEFVAPRRSAIRAHHTVLEAIDGPVIPVRFGTVLPDEQRLRTIVLEPHEQALLDQLDRLAAHVELSLRVSYDEELVLQQIVRSEPEIARLRGRIAGQNPEAVHAERVRLGELVALALEERRARDRENVLDRVAPLATDVRADVATGEYGVVSAAFLVPRSTMERFDRAVEALGEELAPLLRFRYVGPLVPYSFADLELDG